MDRIRAIAASGTAMPEPWEKIEVGQRVTVTAGPMRGAYGVLARRDGQMHLILQIEMLGRALSIPFEGPAVEAA